MIEFLIILFLIIVMIIYGVIEYRKHQKLIYTIPIRIHVNGTRGKSSVARLIGAGLRAGGIRTITKVTGTFPRLVLPDGKETAIYRKGKANILEQLKIVKFVSDQKAQAMVIECMALQPIYQKITENQMIHATIGVITNVRLDHLDVMGPGLMDVAKALSSTIPKNQKFYTSDTRLLDYLKNIAAKRNTETICPDPTSIEDEVMKGFMYLEHKENVALALTICKSLGVNRQDALKGMYATIPDEGVLTKSTVPINNFRTNFFNGFAANDPESSLVIWNSLKRNFEGNEITIVLLNTRQDRLERSEQLAELTAKHLKPDYFMLMGESTNVVQDMAVKFGFEKNKIINVGWCMPADVFDAVAKITVRNSTVFSIGNMGGKGADTAKYFYEKGKIK